MQNGRIMVMKASHPHPLANNLGGAYPPVSVFPHPTTGAAGRGAIFIFVNYGSPSLGHAKGWRRRGGPSSRYARCRLVDDPLGDSRLAAHTGRSDTCSRLVLYGRRGGTVRQVGKHRLAVGRRHGIFRHP
jgi:hypothetical protein